MNEPETIRRILKESKTIAVVGLSDNPDRDSYAVAKYLKDNGYRIIPGASEASPGEQLPEATQSR